MSYLKSLSLKPLFIKPSYPEAPMTAEDGRKEMDRLLNYSMLFSCLLAVFRVIHTGRSTFLFLIWNLFLAYVPYVISGWMSRQRIGLDSVVARVEDRDGPAERVSQRKGGIGMVILFVLWLLFVPNTFYILTDLYHLGDSYNDRQVPQWFDLVLILSFAWNGLLLGVLSVRHVEKLLQPWLSRGRWRMLWGRQGGSGSAWLFVYPIMWLNALGVYTGRYLRYNSWEIVSNPFRLLIDIARMIIHPLQHHYAWDMIFCFSILMTLIYMMMKRMSRVLA
jgi:uncharacterized membrane protein